MTHLLLFNWTREMSFLNNEEILSVLRNVTWFPSLFYIMNHFTRLSIEWLRNIALCSWIILLGKIDCCHKNVCIRILHKRTNTKSLKKIAATLFKLMVIRINWNTQATINVCDIFNQTDIFSSAVLYLNSFCTDWMWRK